MIKLVQAWEDKENNLTEKYDIQAVPTTIIEVNGKEINRFTGPKSKQEVLDRMS